MLLSRRQLLFAAGWLMAVSLAGLAPAHGADAGLPQAPTGLTVEASASTPQHPSVDVTVRWQGIDDISADYEVEQGVRRNDSVEPFEPIARAWSPERQPDETFSSVATDAFAATFDSWMCYRVRAVKWSAAGPYSNEACVAGPLAKGAPSTATPPIRTSPPPLRDFAPPPVDPANPLKVRYSTLQGYDGPAPSMARPTLPPGQPVLVDAAAVIEAIPAAAFLDAADAEGFSITHVEARSAPDGRFAAWIYYQAVTYEKFFQRRTITLSSWTLEGDFLYVGFSGSPVRITRQTTVAGLYALTTLPTPAVFEGRDTREVFFTTGDRIYLLVAENYTEDQPVLDIAARLAARYANAPLAPGSGEASPADSPSGVSQLVIVGLVTMAGSMIGLGIWIALARRR